MPASAYVNPKDYFTPLEWAGLTRRSQWKGFAVVIHCWAMIFSAMAVAVIWPNPLTIVLAIMIIGTRQLGLAILMHDAAHNCLHPNPQINDWIGDWLCGAPVGARVASYRKYHLKHHRYAQQIEDPDLSLSAPFPISRNSFWRKVVRDLTSQTFIKQRFAVLGSKLKKSDNRVNATQAFVGEAGRQKAFLLWNLGLFLFLSAMGAWWAFFVLWIVPMATWYPLATRVRNIAEHAMIAKGEADPLRQARTTRAGPIERLFLAPYWVNYHCEHHMFMHLPCWSLPKAHRMIRAKNKLEGMLTAANYFDVLSVATGKSAPAA